MNGIDAERDKKDESPEQARLRHEARRYRPGYFTQCSPPCPVDLCAEWSKAGMCSHDPTSAEPR